MNFISKNRRAADDYGPLITALKAIGLPAGPAFDRATTAALDVDEWLRAYALVALVGSGDHYAGDGIPHNVFLYTRPTDGKTMFFIWDTDFAFDWSRVPPTSPLTRNADLKKFVRNPANLRQYYWHLLDILRTSGNARYMERWAKHYSSFCPGQDFSRALDYLRQREQFILSQLPLSVSFVVTNPPPSDFTTARDKLELAGTAPLDLNGIEVNGTNRVLTWNSPTAWSASVSLKDGTNRLVIQGFDRAGARLSNALQTLTVVRRMAGPSRD